MGDPVFAQKSTEHANVIRAEKFELADKDGKVLAKLELNISKNPTLILIDGKGVSRAELALLSEGPILKFNDEQGNMRIGLAAQANFMGIQLLEKGGLTRAGFGTVSNSDPMLQFNDKNGNRRALFGVNNGTDPSFALYDQNNKARAMLGSTMLLFGDEHGKVASSVSAFGLSLDDIKGVERLNIGLQENGDPTVALYDGYRKKRGVVGLFNGTPLIALMNEYEKPIWAAP